MRPIGKEAVSIEAMLAGVEKLPGGRKGPCSDSLWRMEDIGGTRGGGALEGSDHARLPILMARGNKSGRRGPPLLIHYFTND